MRRVAQVVIAGFLGVARIAGAEPWTLTVEGGAEADSNVERVETGIGLMTERIAAPVGRAGARIGHRGRLFGGAYVLGLFGLGRMVVSREPLHENVMLYAGDLRWMHAVDSRPVAVGIGLTAADALSMTGGVGARTFRNLGGDALVLLGSGEDRHLTLAVGWRDFVYKAERTHVFDWHGPIGNARLDVVLWQTSRKTRSLELAALVDFQARRYASTSLINVCPPQSSPDTGCTAGTSAIRNDRYQRASLDLTWTGEVVATAGYQLTVIDSNSYGQSLVRHRVAASVTVGLADKWFGSANATLQLDQYPDGLAVSLDAQRTEFTNLEDENRSSLQIRIARELSAAWSLEARAAMWHDFETTDTASFRRELVYAGVIYSF